MNAGIKLANMSDVNSMSDPVAFRSYMFRAIALCAIAIATVTMQGSASDDAEKTREPAIASILVYHRFGQAATDAMTVRTQTFRRQLAYLAAHDYRVVPLRSLVSYLEGHGAPLSPRAVVITVDDGHVSVFTEMLPVIREYRIPVTLFVYPSAVSNASYALTWTELQALRDSGLVDVQSHTFWHPNFHKEKRRLSEGAYVAFVGTQLDKSKSVLEKRLGGRVDQIAWPFGVYDDELSGIARRSGYVAGLTLDRRKVTSGTPLMMLPRFLVSDRDSTATFATMLPRETP